MPTSLGLLERARKHEVRTLAIVGSMLHTSSFTAARDDIRDEIRYAVGECSLGSILVAATASGVCAILLGDEAHELVRDLERRFDRARLVGADPSVDPLVAQVVAQVVELIEQPRRGADLPLDIRGTGFQQRVWQALSAVPAGATTTYSELAAAIGSPTAARAVAGACAANPLAVAIPCHRVIRTDGGLSGYRWGIERKRELLAREYDG
jgi:AraC family transcriptional regulator, regulatory protein of adaptative response / methylated-DNA-[protein]-cysteine methyltransferase